MPGTLPHTQNGLVQTAADQHVLDTAAEDRSRESSDPTTLKLEGKVAISDDEGMDARGRATHGAVAEDAGSDPYNRTGRFRRLVR